MKLQTLRLAVSACLVLALVAVTGAQPKPAKDAPPEASNTSESSRTVRITLAPGSTAPDLNRILTRLFSAQHAGEIAQRTIRLAPEVGRIYASKERMVILGDHSVEFVLRVHLDPKVPGVRLASQEFADALVERLTALLAEDRDEKAASRLAVVKHNARALQDELAKFNAQIRDLRAEFRAASGRADVSPQNIQAALAKLEDERQRLELELAGMQARMEAVQEQIKRATEDGKQSAEADPVVNELRKAVAAREKLLDLVQRAVEAGTRPAEEVSKAEADLVEARVQLLDRAAGAAARGGDAAAGLNRELQNLTIDIRDREARLQHVQKRLEPLRDGGERLADMEMLEVESASARRAWEEARVQLREVDRQISEAPIDRVIVIHDSDIPPQPENN